jgi:hypothetical protein
MNIVDRLDIWVMRLTPLLIFMVLVVSMMLLTLTQQGIARQAADAEARTARLIDVLEHDRSQWEPALEEIERKLDRLLEEQP